MRDWINVKDKLPSEIGRYLVLQTFFEPCISNDKIVRERIPFVSNFRPDKGWMIQTDLAEITHWMTIPEILKA